MSKYDSNNEKPFWAIIGKLLSVLTLIWILIQIQSQIFDNDYRVELKAEYNFFKLPSEIKNRLSWGYTDTWIDSLNSILLQHSLEEIPNYAQFDLRFHQSKIFQVEDYPVNAANVLWTIKLKNTGKKELTSLNLEVPFDGIYELHSYGNQVSTGTHEGIIELGSLRPQNTINVLLWTIPFYDVGQNYARQNIIVTHSNGFFKASLPETVYGFYAWIYANRQLIRMLSILFITILALIVFSMKQKSSSSDRDNEEKTKFMFL